MQVRHLSFSCFEKKKTALVPNFIELFCVYWKSFFFCFLNEKKIGYSPFKPANIFYPQT